MPAISAPVLDALRARAGGGIVAVNPAFIETGRTVYQGHLFVNGVPLHESPLKDHPLNPMHDSNLVRVLARQSASPVGLVPRSPSSSRGPDAIRAALQALASDGNGSAILDSVAPRHLLAIGEAALSEPVSTGASGIGYGLARALVAREGLPRACGQRGRVPPTTGMRTRRSWPGRARPPRYGRSRWQNAGCPA